MFCSLLLAVWSFPFKSKVNICSSKSVSAALFSQHYCRGSNAACAACAAPAPIPFYHILMNPHPCQALVSSNMWVIALTKRRLYRGCMFSGSPKHPCVSDLQGFLLFFHPLSLSIVILTLSPGLISEVNPLFRAVSAANANLRRQVEMEGGTHRILKHHSSLSTGALQCF